MGLFDAFKNPDPYQVASALADSCLSGYTKKEIIDSICRRTVYEEKESRCVQVLPYLSAAALAEMKLNARNEHHSKMRVLERDDPNLIVLTVHILNKQFEDIGFKSMYEAACHFTQKVSYMLPSEICEQINGNRSEPIPERTRINEAAAEWFSQMCDQGKDIGKYDYYPNRLKHNVQTPYWFVLSGLTGRLDDVLRNYYTSNGNWGMSGGLF